MPKKASSSKTEPATFYIITPDSETPDEIRTKTFISPSPDSKLSNSEFRILKALECPICLRYMVPPIRLCVVGHSVCLICKPKFNGCPTCGENVLDTRCLSMENIAKETNYPCAYRSSGCTKICTVSDIREHEAECRYTFFQCPYSKISKQNCGFCGFLPDIHEHVKECHGKDHLEKFGKYEVFLEDVTNVIENRHSVFMLGELFYMVSDLRDGKVQSIGFYIGAKEEAANFKYTVSLGSKENELFSECLPTNSYFEDKELIIEKGKCITISSDIVQTCTLENSLIINFEISGA